MNARSLSATLLIALSLTPALAAQSVPYLPVPRGAAVILDTGSTNTAGYRIIVQRDGTAEYIMGGERRTVHISAGKTTAIFNDLVAAMPLSHLSSGHCMKSASFGSSTFAWWRGQRSPDLQCASDPRATALYASISGLVIELGLARRVMRPLPTNEPRRPMPEPSPSTSM